MKTILLCLGLFVAQLSFSQSSFSWTVNDSIVQDVPSNASTQLKIEQTNLSNGALTLGVEIIYNDIPTTWDGMVCVFGTCFGTIPVVGFTGSMSELNDIEKGYVRLTVNPLGDLSQVKLRARVYDVDNPTDSDTCTWILNSIATSGIENNIETEFSVFPIPTNNFITVKSNVNINSYEIFDITGKIVIKSEGLEVVNKIDVSNLVNGVYFISIYNGNEFLGNKKMIING